MTAKKPVKHKKPASSQCGADQRRKLFAEAYLTNGGNASEAALTAGYAPKSASVTGCVLLKHPKVLEIISSRQKELSKKYELTTESVIKSLAQAVHFDPRKLYRDDGSLKPINELDDDTAAALAGFEVSEDKAEGMVVGYTKKVKWLDKNTAREQAMKHLGLYLEDNKQKSPLEGLSLATLKIIAEKLGGKR